MNSLSFSLNFLFHLSQNGHIKTDLQTITHGFAILKKYLKITSIFKKSCGFYTFYFDNSCDGMKTNERNEICCKKTGPFHIWALMQENLSSGCANNKGTDGAV